MALAFLSSRGLWDRIEYTCVALGALCSAVTATQTQDYKRIPATLAFGFSAFAAVAKWQSKSIEERERRAKEERDERERRVRAEELTRLRSEREEESERRDKELEEIRERSRNAIRGVMRVILEELHKKYFRQETDEEKHKHRATLFVCEEYGGNPSQGKRLAIFARAGVHEDSTTSWPVDDNDPNKCRGIAARIWFHGVGAVTTAARDWPSDENLVEMAQYAESLNLTVDEARGLNVKSKVFTGVRIMVRGRKWGVLLLDSLKEGHIEDRNPKKKMLAECADLICAILSNDTTQT